MALRESSGSRGIGTDARGRTRGTASAAVVVALVCLAGCERKSNDVAPKAEDQGLVATTFYTGLAALEVGDDVRAEDKLSSLTRLAPDEPTGWADWGVLALRQGNLDAAAERLAKATALAPADAHLWSLTGLVEARRGRSPAAIAAFRKAVERAPGDLRTGYLLVQEIEREGGADSDAEAERVVAALRAAQPDNLAVLLEAARLAARRDDGAALDAALAKVHARSAAWPQEVKDQLDSVRDLAARADRRAVASRMTRLRNAMGRVAAYREDLAAIRAPVGTEVEPVRRLLVRQAPSAPRAVADAQLRFTIPDAAKGDEERWSWVGGLRRDDTGNPVLMRANGTTVRIDGAPATLPFPGGASHRAPAPEGILQVDFSYDFRTDLVLAGAGGVRLYRQGDSGRFDDVTASTGLPKVVTNAPYTGAWAADIDQDGDLDVVLGATTGAPVVLRNNGDGTFDVVKPFDAVSGLRQFAWIDLDGDGVCDVALIDGSGRLRVFMNRRQGHYVERALPDAMASAKAIAVGDANRVGGFALFVVDATGAILRVADRGDAAGGWDVSRIAAATDAADDVRLQVADLDNNGIVDLIVSPSTASDKATRVWLGQPDGTYTSLDQPLAIGAVLDVADLSGNGRLDLLAVSAAGEATVVRARPTLDYHWQTVRPRAAQAFGDQRINPFGVGGAVELRAGLDAQRRPITGPVVHFGLGAAAQSDVVRVLWPNGVVQAEFEIAGDRSIAAEQRLKGSCPFMFAWDGHAMSFVKDTVPWSSAIGLRINTLGSASIVATEEWYKIPGAELAPRDGFYDIRITGELWEVYYYDWLALTGVDHPAGTEVFVDERFVIPPAPLAITVVDTPRPVQSARDDDGRDVTATLHDLDGKLLDTFGRGQYQGVTKDHYVELDLGEDARVDGPLWLIAHGSLRPTDSSVNVALSQGKRWVPHGLVLEVPDGNGGWKTANDNLGFPAGRKKIVLVDLSKAFVPGTARRVRLRTNLEVFWDQIQWARGRPDVQIRTFDIPTASADLHYRGYSSISAPPAGAPEIPDYDRVVGTRQKWRDLIGFFTRYGDVRELLKATDDRYVIMNAGDEMSFRFPVAAAPPAGWVRDFVIKGDGWIKDGDYNSTFSKTVAPLPHHSERDYDKTPGRLEDEWAFKHHPEDWVDYHTRYIDPSVVGNALMSGR